MTKEEEKDLYFLPEVNNSKKDDKQDLHNLFSNLSIKVLNLEIHSNEKNEIDLDNEKKSGQSDEERSPDLEENKDISDCSSDVATSDDENHNDYEVDENNSEDQNYDTGDDENNSDDWEGTKDGNEINYLKRGTKSDTRNRCNRYSPLKTQQSQDKCISYASPSSHSSYSDSVFDLIKFDQSATSKVTSEGNGLQQSPPFFSPNSHLPLQPAQSLSLPPYYATDFQVNFNQKDFCGYEPEDGQDSNQIGTFNENENLKDSEDLINIINTINLCPKWTTTELEPTVIPEKEFLILKNVLKEKEEEEREEEEEEEEEEDASSIRDQMSVYLMGSPDCGPFQTPFTAVEDASPPASAADFAFRYEEPLTPPNSVPQPQDAASYCSLSTACESGPNNDFDSCSSEEDLTDMLNGIDKINPEELNIYLDKGNSNNSDHPCYARSIIQSKCSSPIQLAHVLRKLSSISPKVMCEKDKEGDTGIMIVYSKPEDSPDFFENIFCLQEKALKIKVCCDCPLGKAKRCKICANDDPSTFYTPLSLKNKNGDTALSCALKMGQLPEVVNYLLHGVLQCEEDFRRVFDQKGRAMIADLAHESQAGFFRYLERYE